MKNLDNIFVKLDSSTRGATRSNRQFDQFEATTLFCSHCKQAVPVRKKLLLALPDGDKYDYLCVHCGNSAGTKTERGETPVPVLLR